MYDELWFTAGVLSVFGCLLVVILYVKLSAGVCTCKNDLSEQVVLITGASCGIGLETARDLARRKARVIITCRDLKKGKEALHDIVSSTGNSNVVLKKLNLASLGSIRGFAEDIATSQDRLDVLINNAGVITKAGRTEDGLETIMATNYFGPFLLTHLLLPLLKKSASSRIIMVAATNHLFWNSRIAFDNLHGEKGYSFIGAYGMSKLAVILFVGELSRILKDTGVTVNALHPGFARTCLMREFPLCVRVFLKFLLLMFFKSSKQGAQTSIHLAVSERLKDVTGKYFSDCREEALVKKAKDSECARRLWLVSEQVTEPERMFG